MHALTHTHAFMHTHADAHANTSLNTLNALPHANASSAHLSPALSLSHTQHTRMPPRKNQAPQQQQQQAEEQAAPFTRLLDCDDVLGKVYASCADSATKHALCHALEDFILNSKCNPLVITAFQQGKWYLQEADRYGDIAGKARKIAIMAAPGAGFAEHPTSQKENVDLVSLDAATC